jgi:hypothetical protein
MKYVPYVIKDELDHFEEFSKIMQIVLSKGQIRIWNHYYGSVRI